MSRILVTGVTGQVGRSLAQCYANQSTIELITTSRAELDLSDADAVHDFVIHHRPDVVINPAAYTAVDNAESDVELSECINAAAPAAMARACNTLGSLLVHYSTDYVFSGDANTAYREDHPTSPLGVYGRTKLAGEHAIIKAHDRHMIIRTSWVYDQEGANFVNTMLRLAKTRDALSVVDDQYGSPTYAPDLAQATIDMVAANCAAHNDATPESLGVYHLCGTNHTTWCEFARTIFDTVGLAVTVTGIPTKDYPTPAPRPAWSVLDTSKAQTDFNIQMPTWQDALKRCLKG